MGYFQGMINIFLDANTPSKLSRVETAGREKNIYSDDQATTLNTTIITVDIRSSLEKQDLTSQL
jgi:hypothetical protein